MGGYLACRWAQLHPERVAQLLLLCARPSISWAAGRRWWAGDNMALWERQGWLPMEDAHGHPTPVHFGLIEDARRHPSAPAIPCPAVIVHGRQDEIVPIASSRRYTREHPDQVLRLVEVDDDHRLGSSANRIERELLALLADQEAPLG